MLRTLGLTASLLSLSTAYPTDSSPESTPASLEWAPCDLDFELPIAAAIEAHGEPLYCATLTVPLDYTDDRNEATVDLQLIKVKATKEPFKGSVLTNPGGPGGSGVDWIAVDGLNMRDDFGGHHDVIGFDPRGTGRTLSYSCVSTVNSTASKIKRTDYNFTIPQIEAYPFLKDRAWNDGGLWADQCDSINADIGPYIGTTFVARDMLEIVTALGEDQLQYYGISYGTVLGQTFAGMFPDKVKRIVLDSTLRFDDYWAGHWQTVTRDTERALVNFFSECIGAGPVNCPNVANFSGPDTTVEDLHQELANVLQELIDDPIYLPEAYQPQPWSQPGSIPLYKELKYILLGLAYRPDQFGYLYLFIDIALRRAWEEFFSTAVVPPSNSTTPTDIPWNLGTNAFHGITCTDSLLRADEPEDLYSLVQAQQASGAFGDTFGQQIWPCAQWKTSAKEQYTGPFLNIKTSYPILFVQGTHDPITPLSGAYEAAANFPDSRIVVQDGHGHGTRNHPSSCTIKAVADYLGEGTMPEAGLRCKTDQTAYEYFIELMTPTLNGTQSAPLQAKRAVDVLRRSLLPM